MRATMGVRVARHMVARVNGRAWTESEDAVLRENPDLTAKEIALRLGRNHHVVQKRRIKLGLRPSNDGERKNRRAHAIGRRTVVAKTCTACGLLLDAYWYGVRVDGRSESRCRACRSRLNQSQERRGSWFQAAQSVTKSAAIREGDEWTESDYAILTQPDLSLVEMALALGRSYASVANARHYGGASDRLPALGEPEETWVIKRHAVVSV